MNARELVARYSRGVAALKVQRLLGFWFVWHAYGGHDQLVDAGWSRRTVYQLRHEFREVFGVEVEDFLPEGVSALDAGGVLMGSIAHFPDNAPAEDAAAVDVDQAHDDHRRAG